MTAKGIQLFPQRARLDEVVEFRESMNLTHAFIVENGAALYVPMDTDIRCPMGGKLLRATGSRIWRQAAGTLRCRQALDMNGSYHSSH